MTRLTDLPPAQAKRLAEVECPVVETWPWISGPPLPQRRVAIVSSAGLFQRCENPADQPHLGQFRPYGPAGRLERRFPARPIEGAGRSAGHRLRRYSFMGASDPVPMEPHARERAGRLKQDHVNSILLAPV